MASPKKYRASLARVHVRILWLNVQKTRAGNRTQEDWLSAANRELLDAAQVKVGLGTVITAPPLEQPNEPVLLVLSYEALCGIKMAIVEMSRTAAFRERQDLLEAAKGFGEEFEKAVRKAAKLPEADDPEGDEDLKDIPAIEVELAQKEDLK